MNSSFTRPDAMISLPIALAREMSDPTWMPSQASAHLAVDESRGSTPYSFAPLRTPART